MRVVHHRHPSGPVALDPGHVDETTRDRPIDVSNVDLFFIFFLSPNAVIVLVAVLVVSPRKLYLFDRLDWLGQ